MIEGGVNAQLRSMLRNHRGLFYGTTAQGDLLVVLHAYGVPLIAGRDNEDDADRR